MHFQLISKCLRFSLICGTSKGKIQIGTKEVKWWPCRQPRSSPSGQRQARGQRGVHRGWSQPGRPPWRTSPGKRSQSILIKHVQAMKYNYRHRLCADPQLKRGSWKQLELHSVFSFKLFRSFFNPFSIRFSFTLFQSYAFFGFWFLPIAVCISFGENLYFCFAFASIFHSLTSQLVIVGEYFLNLWPYMQNSNCHSFHYNFHSHDH